MKKCIVMILLSHLLLILCGCAMEQHPASKAVFYYSMDAISYNGQETALVPVPQNVSVKDLSLEDLLACYLQTPGSKNFSNKLYSARIYAMVQDDTKLYLTLSNEARYLEGIDLTIGCVALAQTVFSLTDFETIIIDCQNEFKYVESPLVLTRNNILLTDNYGLD